MEQIEVKCAKCGTILSKELYFDLIYGNQNCPFCNSKSFEEISNRDTKGDTKILKIGDKVKFNINRLEKINWIGLKPDENINEKNYEAYIKYYKNKEFKILNIHESYSQYVIDDEFLKDTSFEEDELIKI